MPSGNHQFNKFSFPHADKVVHFTMYFILGILLINDITRKETRILTWKKNMLLIAVLLIYGILTEIVQYYFIPSRDGDFFDFMANALGVFSGIPLYNHVLAPVFGIPRNVT